MSEARVPPAAAEQWEELARRAAQEEPAGAGTELLRELLVVDIGGDPYALPVERVREILRWRPPTPVPCLPPEILGVLSLRGEMIQVIDLKRRLRLGGGAPPPRARIVVLQGDDGGTTGLVVDRVREVLRIEEAAILPEGGEGEAVVGLCRKGDEFVSLLDVDRVLDFGVDE